MVLPFRLTLDMNIIFHLQSQKAYFFFRAKLFKLSCRDIAPFLYASDFWWCTSLFPTQNLPKISLHGNLDNFSPQKIHCFPRWVMKDNGHSKYFWKKSLLIKSDFMLQKKLDTRKRPFLCWFPMEKSKEKNLWKFLSYCQTKILRIQLSSLCF